MSKMNKWLFRSVTAVALSLAMAMSLSGGVVLAVPSTSNVIATDTVAGGNTPTETESGNHSFTGADSSVDIEIDNESSFTITLPKIITIPSTSTATSKEFSYYIDCNLAPELTLSVSTDNVILKNRQGVGTTFSHTVQAVPSNAAANDTCTAAISTNILTLSPKQYQNNGINTVTGGLLEEKITLTTSRPILAGHWKGLLNVHVTVGGHNEAQ